MPAHPRYVPVPARDLRGARPLRTELSAAPAAIAELEDSDAWSRVVGVTADNPRDALRAARAWGVLLAQSEAWCAYVRSEHGVAWKAALRATGRLKGVFAAVFLRQPEVALQYPALTRMLRAQGVVARRAAATRAQRGASAAADAPMDDGGVKAKGS